jgi:hypothetical protein
MGWISGLWTQGFKWKLCLEEPISNLRKFLSAKRLLGHVTKLRRGRSIIKLRKRWYLATGREITTLVVLGL